MLSKLEAALVYASWGWKVIALLPNDKKPATAHGVHDATSDLETIKSWWTQDPNRNIGIAAGEPSGLMVFDIDPRNGGEDSWNDWLKENGDAPDGIVQLTAGGGQHYIANYQSGFLSCKLRQGIDFLSTGKYFVVHPSTIDGRSYEWEASSDPFEGVGPMQVPDAWLDSMSKKHAEVKSNTLGNIIKGDRNNGLTSLAGGMRNLGMQENEILDALMVVNDSRCSPPLPDSEVRQIAKSVSRYHSDRDVASDSALGAEAAELLLADAQANSDYFFTRATSFLSQPVPLEWAVKKYIPEKSIMMLYGESCVGKSFVAIDIACHIALGKEWNGMKTKRGKVAYMAGEGNYGIGQRISSWAKFYGVDAIDDLYISNRPIDLDAPNAAMEVITSLRDMSEDDMWEIVFIDTMNNHMSGDENSAKDTRTMLNAMKVIQIALNCGVTYVHHSGNNPDAKFRARGSSTLKASCDVVAVVHKLDDGTIAYTTQKMKDSEAPPTVFGNLLPVDLGWFDSDGDPIGGAVFTIDDNYVPVQKEKASPIDKHFKMLQEAWLEKGQEISDNGNPYITRSALKSYLLQKGFYTSDASVDNALSPAKTDKLIGSLVLAGIINVISYKGKATGYEVVNELHANSLILLRN